MAEWSKAADLRSVGQSPREFEPRFLQLYFLFFCLISRGIVSIFLLDITWNCFYF
ncbi:hypothetical protein HANVADRAFT_52872 [Hanseniaspora valbyensis NRRL Y-1626]|uniref:Uncharacterized protein n=1 Tax=Hanseniaspora valbyensis NRRL Y-1626 TaxID=766949 RepID=A0A1B7TDL3_9ASCO|nr:hypothetical protein HANVADRAFT_52872 [Hanseniaspora valbyensis NRRL Y-1626]